MNPDWYNMKLLSSAEIVQKVLKIKEHTSVKVEIKKLRGTEDHNNYQQSSSGRALHYLLPENK